MNPSVRSRALRILGPLMVAAIAGTGLPALAGAEGATGALAVTLTDDWGRTSNPGVVVEVRGEQSHLRMVAADGRGVAIFPALPPGLFLVTAREAISGRVVATVRSGETTHVELGTEGLPGDVFRPVKGANDGTGVLAVRLQMVAAWEDAGTSVSIRDARGRASAGRTDRCGRVLFPRLPPGPVDLACGDLLWNHLRATTIRPGETTFVQLFTKQHGIIRGVYDCCVCGSRP